MLKDRAQKATALKLCVSKGWLAQLEVEIEPSRSFDKSRALLTDLDVLAIAPAPIGGHSRIVFDCKSGVRESAIGRAFWLHGVMSRFSIAHGFIILNDKVAIHRDHRVSAADIAISLVHENEVGDLAKGMGASVTIEDTATTNLDAWETLLSIPKKYPKLEGYCRFSRSGYWMIKDHGEQCRKTIGRLRAIHGELDPAKVEHLAVFGDALCLFLLSLSELSTRLFLLLLRPASRDEFSSSLMSLVYGGFDNLEMAQRLRKLAAGAEAETAVSIFPEIEKFEHLVRELLQVPQQALTASILARELCLSSLVGTGVNRYQRELCAAAPYASKYLFLASDYLRRAVRAPPEFCSHFSDIAFGMQPLSQAVPNDNSNTAVRV